MIENIRKYSGLIMVVLVVSALAFILGDYNRSSRAMDGGHGVIRVAGRTYDEKDFRNLGQNSYKLSMTLAQYDLGFRQFLMGLAFDPTGADPSEKLFTSRIIVRNAKEEFGIYPGDEEITHYLRNMPLFTGPTEQFNAEAYNNFIERQLGQLGMTEKDLRELVSDLLVTQKLNEIVGSGLTADHDSAAMNLALQNQKISGEVAKLDLTPFETKIEPTEDEITKYWEKIRDAFTTEPKRKFTYIIATPEAPKEIKNDTTPDSIADATATDEVKKAAEKKKEEEKAKTAAEAAEDRRKKQLAIDKLVDDFLFNLEEQKGVGFEDLAKANKWEVKTSEFFSKTSPPKDIDVNLRSSSRRGKAVDELFLIRETSDPFSKFSEAIAIGENQWLVARLDGEEVSRPKTYEEARAEARAQYISEKAAEALKTATNDAVTKIKTLMTAGKSFADAAKDAGIPETKAFTSIASTYRPDGATEPQNLFEASRNIDPGSIADVIMESDRAFILYVAKREVVKDDIAAAKVDAEIKSRTNENETYAFVSWISARVEAAKVELLYKR